LINYLLEMYRTRDWGGMALAHLVSTLAKTQF
jgi:hypothetical protein